MCSPKECKHSETCDAFGQEGLSGCACPNVARDATETTDTEERAKTGNCTLSGWVDNDAQWEEQRLAGKAELVAHMEAEEERRQDWVRTHVVVDMAFMCAACFIVCAYAVAERRNPPVFASSCI